MLEGNFLLKGTLPWPGDKVARRHFTRPVKMLGVLPYEPSFTQSEFTNVNYILCKLWPLFSAFISFLAKNGSIPLIRTEDPCCFFALKRVLWKLFVDNVVSLGEHAEDVDLDGRDQSLPGFSELGSTAVTGMALWRQQVCAMMRIRFLKLKHEGKFLASM